MEQIDKVSLISIVLATTIIGVDLLNIKLPTQITEKLSNKNTQIALGIAIIIASYYHLPSAIVIASLLYLSLNDDKQINNNIQKVPIEAPTESIQVESQPAPSNLIPNSDQPKEISTEIPTEMPTEMPIVKPLENANEVGVPGFLSDPELEPVKNPLPTQDNNANYTVEKTELTLPENADPTLLNKENLDSLIGFGENDMANVL